MFVHLKLLRVYYIIAYSVNMHFDNVLKDGTHIQAVCAYQIKPESLVSVNRFLYLIIGTPLVDKCQSKANTSRLLLQVCARLTSPFLQTFPGF